MIHGGMEVWQAEAVVVFPQIMSMHEQLVNGSNALVIINTS